MSSKLQTYSQLSLTLHYTLILLGGKDDEKLSHNVITDFSLHGKRDQVIMGVPLSNM